MNTRLLNNTTIVAFSKLKIKNSHGIRCVFKRELNRLYLMVNLWYGQMIVQKKYWQLQDLTFCTLMFYWKVLNFPISSSFSVFILQLLPKPKSLLGQGYHNQTNTPPPPPPSSTLPLTWQHDVKSLSHREQVDGSTACVEHDK